MHSIEIKKIVRKGLFILLLVAILCFLFVNLWESDVYAYYSETDVKWTDGVTGGAIYFDKSTGEITHCQAGVTEVIIPEEIEGVTVSGIGEHAFSCSGLRKIKLTDNIIEIKSFAFSACVNLEEINLPEGLQCIANNSFDCCEKLKSVRIPTTVTEIEAGAFRVCTALETVEMPEGVLSIGDGAFEHCSSLKKINLPSGIRYIRESTFEGSGLESVDIPEGVTAIDSYAFKDCIDLENVKLPNSLKSIITGAFKGCIRLKDVAIPNQVEELCYSCFSGCTGLTSIIIPKSVQGIWDYAFEDCTNLKTVTIENGVSEIQFGVFRNCTSLSSVTIPASVIKMGENIFSGYDTSLGVRTYYVEPNSYAYDYILKYCRMENQKISCIGEHTWKAELTVDKEPTCTEEGRQSIHCEFCDVIKEDTQESIPWKGHTWNIEYTVDKEPTCTEEGSKSIHCKDCNTVKENSEVVIEKKAHNWDVGKVTKEATCTSEGVKTFTCDACEATKTEPIEAKGHTWNTEYTVDKEPNCTEEGSKSIHCKKCDVVKENSEVVIGKKAHNWNAGEITKEATCTSEGVKTYTCNDCKAIKTESIGMTAHVWNTAYTVDKEPTCTEEGSKSIHCKDCNTVKENSEVAIAQTAHNWNAGEVTKEATCTSEGVKTYTCNDCKATKTEPIEIKVHNWNTEYTVDQEATCMDYGLKSIHCKDCGTMKNGSQVIIPRTDHNWDSGEIIAEADCLNPGEILYTCKNCGEYRYEDLEMTDHTWDTEYTIDEYPTDTEKGIRSIHCTYCYEIKEGSEEEFDYSSIASSGKCGENLTWTLNYEGTLTIDGTGAMTNYDVPIEDGENENVSPWSKRGEINRVVIGKDVTSIGNNAFYECYDLYEVKIPLGIKTIGMGAFYKCESLSDIYISNGIESIGEKAFYRENTEEDRYYHIIPESYAEKYLTPENAYGGKINSLLEYGYRINDFKLLKVGETAKLELDPNLWVEDFEFIQPEATWKSSNEKIVEVDQQGNIKAKRKGNATIITTIAGQTLRCAITVDDIKADISLSELSDTFDKLGWTIGIDGEYFSTDSENGIEKAPPLVVHDYILQTIMHMYNKYDRYEMTYEEYMKYVDDNFTHYPDMKPYLKARNIYDESKNIVVIEGGGRGGPCDWMPLAVYEKGTSIYVQGLNMFGVVEDGQEESLRENYDYYYSNSGNPFKITNPVLMKLDKIDGKWKIDMYRQFEYYIIESRLYEHSTKKAYDSVEFSKGSGSKIDVVDNTAKKFQYNDSHWVESGKELKFKVDVEPCVYEVMSVQYEDATSKGTLTPNKDGVYSKKINSATQISVTTKAGAGHQYTTTVKKATTSQNGSITEKCKVCGNVKSSKVIYAPKTMSLSTTAYAYNGYAKKPSVTIKDTKGNTLVNGTDYTVSYASGRTKIGRYGVKITFKGNYSGTKTLYFTIGPKNPTTVSTKLYGYDDVKVSWSNVSGESGYAVYYKKSTSSTYTLYKRTTSRYTSKANLTDGAKYYFKIVPYKTVNGYRCYSSGKVSSIYTLKKISTPSISKYSSSRVKVSWTNIYGESGYQISKSTSKTGTNVVYTYKTTTGKSKTISATKGKTYYYKVRAYKTVDGKKIYGPWSYVKAYKLR